MQIPETNPQMANIPMSAPSLYETDFYGWTQQQVDLIRKQQWNQIEWQNVIEEIESLGKQQRQELRNRLSVLVGHLLKWQFQPQCRSRSWLATLRIQRRDTLRLLQDNPSLKSYLDDGLVEAYENARDLAMGETDLPEETFPLECPYDLEDIFSNSFYPGEPSELVNRQ
ncbi:DUF29 domain-containing protein [Calothrix sp. PCC 6303]|uniref:DUF29 domain-containing protein n=1 Tax=Calothrix sp. PCC 6303 TaxID=1170562 RepID=UPI0002A021EC|nr:DUF29 domain-containing protein [Calothrix sp. PCC 6303]AFZ00921.1 protein of unknown function DUF29 [Calothrix sp. PCC 6303]